MVKKIGEHWFGLSLLFMALLGMAFLLVVSVAPHNDAKMRGFAPCTYEMATTLSAKGSEMSISGVLGTVANSYICYAAVMHKGIELWLARKQQTPWENYMFEAETFEVPPELSEPLSDDLLKANRLDELSEQEKNADGTSSIKLGD